MQNQVKKYFRLTHVEGYDCEGETISTIACRHCSLEDIITEVEGLNKEYPDYELRVNGSDWCYYDYEELFFNETGEFNPGVSLRSFNYDRNKKGLINALTSKYYSFDQRVEHHNARKEHYTQYDKNFDLKDRVIADYSEFIVGEFTKEDFINTIMELGEAGKIKTDLSLLGF